MGWCDACGAALVERARFCSACGTPAGSGPAAERRVVTVVFADLAGFTSLAEGLDPETVKDLLDRCFSGLIPVIERHGGTVDKVIGDELMAVFGAPVGHEDDPERAVRAALGLLDQLSSVGSELVLRVGVNTGEVLAGPVGPGMGSTVTGDAVNTAHRLVSVALPGEILVGERTWAATSGVIAYEERPPYELRGKQAPVRAWSALCIVARPGGDRQHPGADSPLVGRHLEMAQLGALTTTTLHHHQQDDDGGSGPTVVVITGEPGLGKTRLATAFARDQESGPDGVRVVWTSCPAYGAQGGLEPIAELLRMGLMIDSDSPPGVQVEQLASRLASVADATGTDPALLTARLAQLLGLHDLPQRVSEPDPGPTRARVVDQLLAAAHMAFAGIAAQQPTILVIDDLQWADDAVLAFLERLPSRVGPASLLVLALGRDELLERRAELARGRAGVVLLPLRPLDPVDAAELLAAMLHPRTRPAAIGPVTERRILAAAGGNPLLLEQLVEYLVESGALVRVAGSWQATTGGDAAGLPDGIRSLIGARLDALPDEEHHLLQHAAVVGGRFWADAVADLSRVVDPSPGLEALVRRGLIESVATDPRPGEFAFRHVLTRDVAYAAISLADRAHLHAQVARWLRDRYPDDGSAPLIGLLAHHYERAVVLSREIDRTDPGLAGAAFGALVRAAEEAERREAIREAEQWYARARELGTFDHDTALEVTLAHGRVLVDLRRLELARSAFELVRRQATGPDADPPRADLARTATAWQAVAARLGGDGDVARELFDRVQAECRDLGDIAGEAEILRLQGRSELAAGRVRAAQLRLRRAAELEYRAGGEPTGETLQALGWAEFLVGDLRAAQEHLWSAAGRHYAEDDTGGSTWCFGILCFTFLSQGHLTQARAVADNLLARARVEGDPWIEGICTVLLAACLTAGGDVGAGEPLAAEGLRHFDELGDAWGQVLARLVLGQGARMRGSQDEARNLLLSGLATSRRVTYVGEDARLLAELAGLEADAGDDDAATRRARAALAMVRAGLGDHDTGLRALLLLAELAGRAGDRSGAQLLLEEAIATHDGVPAPETWHQANAALALVLVQRNDAAGARHHLEIATAGLSEGIRTAVALARADAALAIHENRPGDARAALTAVLDTYGDTQLVPLDPLRRDIERLGSAGLSALHPGRPTWPA